MALLLATVGGAVVCGSTIALCQAVSHRLFAGLPADFDPHKATKEQWAKVVDSMPFSSKFAILAGYALASFVAGATTSVLLSKKSLFPAVLVGGIFTITNFMNMARIPHPWWMAIASTVTFVPVTLLGAHMAGGPSPLSLLQQ
jgi:hypothetical protein